MQRNHSPKKRENASGPFTSLWPPTTIVIGASRQETRNEPS
jgi:hypothetical protein